MRIGVALLQPPIHAVSVFGAPGLLRPAEKGIGREKALNPIHARDFVMRYTVMKCGSVLIYSLTSGGIVRFA